MKTLVEATWIKDGTEDEEEPEMETGMYWLWHWALQHDIINMEDNKVVAVNYTVGICSDYDTGQIRCFLPEQLRILGRDLQIKK